MLSRDLRNFVDTLISNTVFFDIKEVSHEYAAYFLYYWAGKKLFKQRLREDDLEL